MSLLIPNGLGMLAPANTAPHPLAPLNSTGMGSIFGNVLSNYPLHLYLRLSIMRTHLRPALERCQSRGPTLAEALYGQRTKRLAYFRLPV